MKPGERLNELELAARFGVSRTPIREALNRLASEGLLVESTRGYIRKPLDIQEMADLYEARMAIERECLRLAFDRATEQQLQDISGFLAASMATPGPHQVKSWSSSTKVFICALRTWRETPNSSASLSA